MFFPYRSTIKVESHRVYVTNIQLKQSEREMRKIRQNVG